MISYLPVYWASSARDVTYTTKMLRFTETILRLPHASMVLPCRNWSHYLARDLFFLADGKLKDIDGSSLDFEGG